MSWKFWEEKEEDLINDIKEEFDNDKFTKKDFVKSCLIFVMMLVVWGGLNLTWEKTKCAYTGHTYEKATKNNAISNQNALNYQYIDDKNQIENK